MIEVPIDRIVPIEEALIDIKKLMDTVQQNKGLYVITKDGKPYSAIIDINLLEHLPEMESGVVKQPISEIGATASSDDNYEDIKIKPEENAQMPPTTPEAQTNPTPAPETPAQSQEDVLNDNIGPWQGNQETKENETNDTGDIENPPDINI